MWIGEQVFDPIGGTTVATELRRLEQQLFDADWNAAKQRLGREPSTLELGRTPSQRRADAWVELAKRSAAMAPGSRMPRPLITVLVGYETFAGPVCQLAGGTVVAPGTVARLLTDADIERVVFDGPSRDVGVRRRLFQGGTRRAVEIRDHNQGCFHPLCDATLDDNVQVDHIHPYAFGGLTTQANGRLACAKHNRGRNTRPPPDDR